VWEEYKLQDFESKIFRKIFGPKRDEAGHLGFYVMGNFVMYTSPTTIRTVSQCKWLRISWHALLLVLLYLQSFIMGGSVVDCGI
jgi:hypothetical protein